MIKETKAIILYMLWTTKHKLWRFHPPISGLSTTRPIRRQQEQMEESNKSVLKMRRIHLEQLAKTQIYSAA